MSNSLFEYGQAKAALFVPQKIKKCNSVYVSFTDCHDDSRNKAQVRKCMAEDEFKAVMGRGATSSS